MAPMQKRAGTVGDAQLTVCKAPRGPQQDLAAANDQDGAREVPGIDKEDLDVSVTERTLVIKGESRHEEETEEGDTHRREIRSGSFSRTVTLPADVDGRKAKASYKDGVIELHLPKRRGSKKHSVTVE